MSDAMEKFLLKMQMDLPNFGKLSVLHSEIVDYVVGDTVYMSHKGEELLQELLSIRDVTAENMLRRMARDSHGHHYSMMIFLDRPYEVAGHISSIREDMGEVAMVSLNEAGAPLPPRMPPAGLLLVRNRLALESLAIRSPFFEGLERVTGRHLHGVTAVVFLAGADAAENEDEDGVVASPGQVIHVRAEGSI